jgi:hypothetical protein
MAQIENPGKDVARRDDAMSYKLFPVAEITPGHNIVYFIVAEISCPVKVYLATCGSDQQSSFVYIFL